MAYSSVRVQFEIGHEASVRTKKTPEGFTHDWEVFLRGADNTDIQYFVEKVVFHLHETFPKPRRVIKDPPYVVKESGYAGFVLPIDVYLKNKEEPKKISFQYDLQLQPSGPPISRVLREPRLFQNPSEDFRRKLIRGGGVGVDSPSDIHIEDFKPLSVIHKTKSTESPGKKYRHGSGGNDSFAEVFGTPIRRVLDFKKTSDSAKKSDSYVSKSKMKISDYESYKGVKELTKNREIEKSREGEKNREKQEKSSHSQSSPINVTQNAAKSKNFHKKQYEKKKECHEDKKKKKEEKEKKEKINNSGKEAVSQQSGKNPKKEERESKEMEHLKRINLFKSYETKSFFGVNDDFIEKEKHKHKVKKKEKDKEKQRKEKDNLRKELKTGSEKDKINKKRREDNREKQKKMRRSKSFSPTLERLKKKPLNALLDELGSSDSVSPLSDDDATLPFKAVPKATAKIPENKKLSIPLPVFNAKSQSTNFAAIADVKRTNKLIKSSDENLSKIRKEKSCKKNNKMREENEEGVRKERDERRLRSISSERENPSVAKEDGEKSEKEKQEEKFGTSKQKERRKYKRDKSEEKLTKVKKCTGGFLDNSETLASRSFGVLRFPENDDSIRSDNKFTKEYVAQLKDLQHKIMTLADNAELQKVVKIIAETGQYEITRKTFDFDLCALDFDTVKRLQDFFLPM